MAIARKFLACVLVSILAACALANKAGNCHDGEQCTQATEDENSMLQLSRAGGAQHDQKEQIASLAKAGVRGPRSINFGPHDWRICDANVQGNLADEELRYSEVAHGDHTGTKLDLVIKIADVEGNSYKGKSENNGKDGCFGMINMDTGSSIVLDFAFYVSGTSTPYTMPNFFFSVYDLDAGKKEKAKESLTFNTPVASVSTSDTSKLVQSGSNDDGTLAFTSSESGNDADNPTDPEELTPVQLDRAVQVEYSEVSGFRVTFAITKGKGSRNVFFAGMSNVQPPPVPPRCDPSAEKISLSADKVGTNDLANTNITYNDVADGVNLVVTTDDTYKAKNIDLNGVSENGFGIINLKSPSAANMHFQFLDASNAPATLQYLYLSFYDIDQYKDRTFEIVKVCTGSKSFVQLHMPENPELEATFADGCTTIKASAEGLDEPTSPTAISDRQKQNSFTLAFSQVEYFDITFEVEIGSKGKPAGRNFLFSGNSAFC